MAVITVFFLLVAAGQALAAPPAKATHAVRPPNILLITVDTLRADHLSAYGYPIVTSPYIDGLAAEGVRFERSYTAIPLTGPSHFAMLTGRYPQEIGVLRNGVSPSGDAKMASLPQILKKHGYRRAAFVSAWPLTSRLTHLDRWFDRFDEELGRKYQLFNSSRYAEDVNPRALKWLRGHAAGKAPFFLWIHYFDPHSPYISREYFQPKARKGGAPVSTLNSESDRERVKDYDSEVYYTDHYIGQMLEELDKLGVKNSTLVVFTADHGESLGEHGYVGHGRHLYENILRVPLVFRLPGKIAAGKVIHTPVSSIDLTPTILDVALGTGLDSKSRASLFRGKSYAAALAGSSEPARRRVYFMTFAGKKGSMPNWLSWIWVQDSELPLAFGQIDGSRKFVWRPEDNIVRLTDVAADPFEAGPKVAKPDAGRYKTQVAGLKSWFTAIEHGGPEQKMSARDVQVLKSLGYIQ